MNSAQKLKKMEEKESKEPVCLVVLGMAGSGKTTFVNKLVSQLHDAKKKPYVINLDPACKEVSYPVNIGNKINFVSPCFSSFKFI